MKLIHIIAIPALLAATLVVPAKAQPFRVLPDVGTLYAYDAKGLIVGAFAPVAEVGGTVGGVIRIEVIDDGIVYLPVKRVKDGMVWNAPPPSFESTDCTGKAFMRAGQVTSIGDHTAFVGLQGMLYIGPPDGGIDSEVSSTKLLSRVTVSSDGQRTCVRANDESFVVPLREIAKLDDTFLPPFGLAPPTRLRATRH